LNPVNLEMDNTQAMDQKGGMKRAETYFIGYFTLIELISVENNSFQQKISDNRWDISDK
jgi:hypothetical protein